MSHFTVLVAEVPGGPDITEQMEPFNEDKAYSEFKHELLDDILPKNGTYLTNREIIKWMSSKLREENEHILFVSESSIPYLDMKSLHLEHDVSLFVWYTKEGKLKAAKRVKFLRGKWDWYVIGGRWRGSLLSKMDAKIPPDASSDIFASRMDNLTYYPNGTDRLYKRDIDIDAMRVIDVARENAFREKFLAAVGDNVYVTWSDFVEDYNKHNPPPSGKSIEELDWYGPVRKAYSALPAIVALTKAFPEYWQHGSLNTDWESRLRVASKRGVSTYAHITQEGGWVSNGDMGWFGISDDHVTEEVWVDMQNEYFNSLPDDAIITILDAHT